MTHRAIDGWMLLLSALMDHASRISEHSESYVCRVLVLCQHRQHIVEAGNPLEVDEGFWLMNILIR